MKRAFVLVIMCIISSCVYGTVEEDITPRYSLFVSASAATIDCYEGHKLFGVGFEYRPYPRASYEFIFSRAEHRDSHADEYWASFSKDTYNSASFGVRYYLSESTIQPYIAAGLTIVIHSYDSHYEYLMSNEVEDMKGTEATFGFHYGAGVTFFFNKHVSVSTDLRMALVAGCSSFSASVQAAFHW